MTTIMGSYDICNGHDILSKILPIFLRLIAVSVYMVAVDSKSIVAENERRMHAIHAEVPWLLF